MTQPLFVFEMANNHMGSVDHGIKLIRAIRKACEGFPFQFGFKLQYRDLDTYIHHSFRGRSDVKYVKRFEETRLTGEQFMGLLQEMRDQGFRAVCTPFDEPSVDLIEKHDFDIIKIASACLTDWSLLERISTTKKPLIASTGGSSLEEIDNAVSFMLHRGKDLTLMHCVAEYPTPDERLHLNQIDLLRARYPEVKIGYSTHENPSSFEPVMIALAKGARVFEKHVGLPTASYAINQYSATPEQVRTWLAHAQRTLALCGDTERYTPSETERAGIHSLRRGIFAARDIPTGEQLERGDIVFGFPTTDGQLTANDWSKYIRYKVKTTLCSGAPILREQVDGANQRADILKAVRAVRQLLRFGNIVVPGKSELEISHHYGMENFDQFGLTMLTVVNREYCKKLIVMLPGQTHPEQYHQKKEETFLVLHGAMTLWLDGVEQEARPGDVITVQRGVKHKFHTKSGVVFEEISSTHHNDDSFYTDTAIQRNKHRKTWLAYWME
jgi:N-acetylneuraminate synthase